MKPPVPTEHAEQAVVIAWWSMYAPLKGIDYRLLFAIPNGAYKSPGQAAKFRKEGLRSGVPDLFLALPRDGKTGNGKAGLFLEMKRQKGKVKPGSEQDQYAQLLRAVGYEVAACAGADEAIGVIERYLKGYARNQVDPTEP